MNRLDEIKTLVEDGDKLAKAIGTHYIKAKALLIELERVLSKAELENMLRFQKDFKELGAQVLSVKLDVCPATVYNIRTRNNENISKLIAQR